MEAKSSEYTVKSCADGEGFWNHVVAGFGAYGGVGEGNSAHSTSLRAAPAASLRPAAARWDPARMARFLVGAEMGGSGRAVARLPTHDNDRRDFMSGASGHTGLRSRFANYIARAQSKVVASNNNMGDVLRCDPGACHDI